MTTTGIIVSIVAALLGAVAGYLLAQRSRQVGASAEHEKALSDARLDAQTARSEASRAREEAANVRSEVAGHLTQMADLRTAAVEAQRETAEVRTELAQALAGRATAESERDSALRLTAELRTDRSAMEDRFKLLSEQSLEAQSAKVDKTANDRMAATQQLVTPLQDHLNRLSDRLNEVEKQRATLSAELREQVQAVKDSGETIRKEALSLSTALRTPQVRGSWGEQSLRRIVEISGLTARCDFDDQTSYTSVDGDRFRPDMRINLADGKVVFVDSKVPLKAVLDAYNTEDQAVQKKHLETFSRHVRGHVDDLSGKNYWHLDAGSPEFVVLFLGSDEFYRLALEQQPDLHEYAARRNVMLSAPGTLIPLLHIVAHGWKQAALAESAAKVSKLGRELHERISTLGEHFEKLGRSINSTVTNFNRAVGAVETRVMVSARRLKELDVVDSDLKEVEAVDASVRELSVPEMIEYSDQQQERRAIEASLFDDQPDRVIGTVRELRKPTGTGDTMGQ